MRTANVVIIYDHKDEEIKIELSKHLSNLKEEGWISEWDTSKIMAGTDVNETTLSKLQGADVVLLLISADFLASTFCQKLESLAFEYHENGDTIIVPVITRPCMYGDKYKKFKVLPTGGLPITSKKYWKSQDEAFVNIVGEIKKMLIPIPNKKTNKSSYFANNKWAYITLFYFIMTIVGITVFLKPVSSLFVKMDLQVESISFLYVENKGNIFLKDLPTKEIQFKNAEQVKIHADTILNIKNTEPTYLELVPFSSHDNDIRLEDVLLNDLKLIENTEIRLSLLNEEVLKKSNLEVDIINAPFSGSVNYVDTLKLFSNGYRIKNLNDKLDVTNLILFSKDTRQIEFSNSNVIENTTLALSLDTSIKIDDLQIQISNIKLTKPLLNPFSAKESSVLNGQIDIEGWKKINVEKENFIKLNNFEKFKITHIEITKDALRLKLEGYLSNLKVGINLEKLDEITPSKMSYLLHNHLKDIVLYVIATLFLIFVLFHRKKVTLS